MSFMKTDGRQFSLKVSVTALSATEMYIYVYALANAGNSIV